MKKENIYIDLSKCSEEERKHIFSLLPKDKITAQIYYMIRNMDWGVLESFNHLFFNKKNVWKICSNRSTKTIGKTELTYPEFIKLFEGGEGEKTTYNIRFGGHVMAHIKITNGEIVVMEAINGFGDMIPLSEITITNSNQ